MSKNWKIAIGIGVVAVGFMLLFALIGGSFILQTRAIPSMLHNPAITESQEETAVPWNDGMRGWRGPAGHFGPRGFSPFRFIGGFFRLAALGLLGWLLFRFLRGRSDSGGGVKARVLNDDAGDEVNSSAEAENLTVDDLLQAMKRLGVKKLEV
ncbi:MAG: hypothetical protein GY803_17285 [Chloroflexi bacterium]|nr:hypothetical protein [Chloroflexota bacterium]